MTAQLRFRLEFQVDACMGCHHESSMFLIHGRPRDKGGYKTRLARELGVLKIEIRNDDEDEWRERFTIFVS